VQQSSSAVQHRCPIYTCTNRSLLAVWHWYTEIRCAESINKTTRPSVGKLLQVETDKNRVFPISPLVTTNYCQALSPWKSNFAAIRSKHFHASSMKDVFSYFTFTPNILSISIIFICLYFHLECMSTDNRGIHRHRIANFPNYVTLTSSLTHHRIVNLGPTALRPLTSAILVSYSPYDVISDVIGNPHYSASYP